MTNERHKPPSPNITLHIYSAFPRYLNLISFSQSPAQNNIPELSWAPLQLLLQMELSPETSPSYPAYPDGGKKAYSVVLGAWLTLFPASGLLNSTGILQAWLFEQDFMDYTESEISWIFSSFAFLFFFGGFIVGMTHANITWTRKC